MTELLGIDQAFAHANPAAVKDAGYQFVIGYVSTVGNPKNFTPALVNAYRAAGLAVGVVFETTAQRSGSGQAAGTADAQAAASQAAELGLPTSVPIFYAVDFATGAATVTPYFRGVQSSPHPVGVYGSLTVVEGILGESLAVVGWQTSAWSGGKVSAKAHLYQRQSHTAPPIAGVPVSAYDENVVLASDLAGAGLWTTDGSPMTTAAQLLAVARSQVGYVETGGSTGHNGNITKYWADLDASLEGSSWCAVFVSWVWRQSGRPLPAIDRPYGYIDCADAVNWAKAHGLWDASGHYSAGDTVLYDFEGHGVAGHTGIVVADDGTTITTIEGNTSPDDGGSQANGGGVYLRHRSHGPMVLGVLRSSTWLGVPSPAPSPTPPAPSVLEDDMAVLVQAPGDSREFAATATTRLYIKGPQQRDDLIRLGLLTCGANKTPVPIGANTLDNLQDLSSPPTSAVPKAVRAARIRKSKAAK